MPWEIIAKEKAARGPKDIAAWPASLENLEPQQDIALHGPVDERQ